MRLRYALALFLAITLTAGIASADYKVTQKHHQDGFAMMGQTQPAKDQTHTTWIGDGRMRLDQGQTSTVVDLGSKKMIIINHDDKNYNEVGLPVNLEELLPPGMAQQITEMMKFEVTITPSEETKKVGEWIAKRYDMQLTSAMMTMNSVLWASEETPIDFSNYHDLYSNVMSLQPGMDAMMDEMRKINGYVVAQEASMSMNVMGETTVASTDEVVSIEELEAPAGIYEAPADYTREDFDYMAMMQAQ
jgi:hypothetical protein